MKRKKMRWIIVLLLVLSMVFTGFGMNKTAKAETLVHSGSSFDIVDQNSLSGMWTHTQHYFRLDQTSLFTFKFTTDEDASLHPRAHIYLYSCDGAGKSDPRYKMGEPISISKDQTNGIYLSKGLYMMDIYGTDSRYNGDISYTLHCETTPVKDTYQTLLHDEISMWSSGSPVTHNVPMGRTIRGSFTLNEDLDRYTEAFSKPLDWYKIHVFDEGPVTLSTSTNMNGELWFRIYSEESIRKILKGEPSDPPYDVFEKVNNGRGRATFSSYRFSANGSWNIELPEGDYYICVLPGNNYSFYEYPMGEYSFSVDQENADRLPVLGEDGYLHLSDKDMQFRDTLSCDRTDEGYVLSKRYIIYLEKTMRIDIGYEYFSDEIKDASWELYETDPKTEEYPEMTGRSAKTGTMPDYDTDAESQTFYLSPGIYSFILSCTSEEDPGEELRHYLLHYKATSVSTIEKSPEPRFEHMERIERKLDRIQTGQTVKGAFPVNFVPVELQPLEYGKHIATYRFKNYYGKQPLKLTFTTNLARADVSVFNIYQSYNPNPGKEDDPVSINYEKDLNEFVYYKYYQNEVRNESGDYNVFETLTTEIELNAGEYFLQVETDDDSQGQFEFCIEQGGEVSTINAEPVYIGVGEKIMLPWKELAKQVVPGLSVDDPTLASYICWEGDRSLLEYHIEYPRVVNEDEIIYSVTGDPDSHHVDLNHCKGLKAGSTMLIGRGFFWYKITDAATGESETKKFSVQFNIPVKVEFTDVRHDTATGKEPYYYTPVYWAVDEGITGGVKDKNNRYSTFCPQNNCTRAQVVSFLWRMAGCPEPKKKVSFSDVPKNAYYYKAVAWAQEKKITGGYSDGTFKPNNPCTRSQAVTFLYRYAGCPKVQTDIRFNDVSAGTYYYEAVAWAQQNGITGGYSNGTFQPDGKCTRGQMVTFLYRYDRKFNQ